MNERKEISTTHILLGVITGMFTIMVAGGGFWMTNLWSKMQEIDVEQNKRTNRIAVLEVNYSSVEKRLENIEKKIDLLLEGYYRQFPTKMRGTVWEKEATSS